MQYTLLHKTKMLATKRTTLIVVDYQGIFSETPLEIPHIMNTVHDN